MGLYEVPLSVSLLGFGIGTIRGRISLVRGHGNSCLGIFWFMRA